MAALRVASALTRGIKRLVMTNDCTKRANGRYCESVYVFFFSVVCATCGMHRMRCRAMGALATRFDACCGAHRSRHETQEEAE